MSAQWIQPRHKGSWLLLIHLLQRTVFAWERWQLTALVIHRNNLKS